MTLQSILEYVNENTEIVVNSWDDLFLGSNVNHYEIPEFTWNKEVKQMSVKNGKLIITLEADNDELENEVLQYLVDTCGYSWEEATNEWNKAKLSAEGYID